MTRDPVEGVRRDVYLAQRTIGDVQAARRGRLARRLIRRRITRRLMRSLWRT